MIHSACIKNTLTKCKTLIGHQKLLEVSMFTPADTISIPTSRLKENIPDIAAITGNTLWVTKSEKPDKSDKTEKSDKKNKKKSKKKNKDKDKKQGD